MWKFRAGQKVESGTYWDVVNGQRVDFDQEGILPGGKEALYLKTPSSAMLFLGPILGLAYIVVMPVMGVVTVAALFVRKIFARPYLLIKNMVSFGWRPNEAYLGGKNRKKKSSGAPAKKKNG